VLNGGTVRDIACLFAFARHIGQGAGSSGAAVKSDGTGSGGGKTENTRTLLVRDL
jgi:hypothetical protein